MERAPLWGSLLSNLTLSIDFEFIGGEFIDSHGTARMEFAGGDSHLRSKAKLSPIRESRGGIDIDARGIHLF